MKKPLETFGDHCSGGCRSNEKRTIVPDPTATTTPLHSPLAKIPYRLCRICDSVSVGSTEGDS